MATILSRRDELKNRLVTPTSVWYKSQWREWIWMLGSLTVMGHMYIINMD